MDRIEAKYLILQLERKNLEDLKRERWGKKIVKLVRDQLYSEKTHFILELIQNADDCASKTLEFYLSKNGLIAVNYGDAFTEIDVKDLSDFGESHKGPEHIGFFGIGFKAVFLVSNRPKIYSDNFSFHYDDNTLIVPHWIENIPINIKKKLESLGEKGAIVVLPLKNKKDNSALIKHQLKKVSASLLLYLNHLKKFVIDGNEHYITEVSPNCFEVKDRNEKSTLWKSYNITLLVPKKIRAFLAEDRRIREIDKRVKEKEKIILTFEVTENGKIKPNQMGKFYAFLPTEVRTDFMFNIQADFSVNLERTALRARGEKWNQWVLSNVYRCIPLIIQDYKNQRAIRTEFYKILPLDNSERPEYLNIVKKKIDEYIQKEDSILVKVRKSKKYPDGKKWVKPKYAVIADSELQRLFDGKDIEHLLGRRKFYVADDEIDDNGMRYVKEILDDELSFDEIIGLLKDSRWIFDRKVKNRKNPEKWVGKLIIFFASELEKKLKGKSWWDYKYEKNRFIGKLSDIRFILTENGKLGNPQKIFLPASEDIDIPSHLRKKYNIINRNLVHYLEGKRIKNEIEKERREKGLNLLQELVSELSPETIVKEIINPAFSYDNWKKYSDSSLEKYINFIRKNKECWGKANIKLKVKTKGKTRVYKEPSDLYPPHKYGNEFNLDVLYKGYDYDNFVSLDYIERFLKSKSGKAKEQITSWKNFLVAVGVNKHPQIHEVKEQKGRGDIEKELKVHRSQNEVKYSNWGYRKVDYDFSPSLKNIINSCVNDEIENPCSRLKVVLKFIDKKWSYYESFLKSKYNYHPFRAEGWSEEELGESSFARFLRCANWIATKDGNHLRPEAVAISELKDKVKTPVIDYRITSEEFKEHLQTLGLQTKPTVEGALALLKALVEQEETKIPRFAEIYGYLAQHEKENKKIIKELKECPCIFMPNRKKKYWKISELFWESEDTFLEWKTYVKPTYPELKDFFLNIFGVKERPNHEDYADFLMSCLWKKEELTSTEKSCLANVYHHLNYIVSTPQLKKSKIWLKLKKEFKIWCENNRWAGPNERVYYHDNDEIYKLFRKQTDMTFAYVPKNVEVKELFAELGIGSLSERYTEKSSVWGNQLYADEYQNEIRRISEYVAHFVREKSPKTFDRLNKEGAFSLLREIKVRFVENIKVNAVVDVHTVHLGERKSFYSWGNSENCLYLDRSIQADDSSCFRHIGIALANALGKDIGLEMFVPLITGKDKDEIKKAMRDYDIIAGKELKIEKKKPVAKEEEPIIHETPQIQPTESILEPKEKVEWQPECEPEVAEMHIGKLEIPKRRIRTLDSKKDVKISIPSSEEKEETGTDMLSLQDKKRIGRWGEGYVLNTCLKKQYINKYPEGKVKETDGGFEIRIKGRKAIEVEWLNKVEDEGEGHDIKIIEYNKEIFIEVKSTITDAKEWFDISRKQWEFAQEKGDNFHIYHVYNAGSMKNAKFVDIQNPVRLWQEGKLSAYPIRIQI